MTSDQLKKNDRVIITIPVMFRQPKVYRGVIVGETRDGRAWYVTKDGNKYPYGIHKKYCRLEEKKP